MRKTVGICPLCRLSRRTPLDELSPLAGASQEDAHGGDDSNVTTIEPTTIQCPACATEFEATVCASTSSFGSPDLDLRPAPPARDAFVFDVAECPSCGFVCETYDDDRELNPDLARQILDSTVYRETQQREQGESSSLFLAAAVVLEARGQHVDAGWRALQAAWLADDDGRLDVARAARLRAGELWLAARDAGETILDDEAEEACLLADVFRRARWFAMAAYVAHRGHHADLDPSMREVLNAQSRLASAQDDAAHLVADAPGLEVGEVKLPSVAPDQAERDALLRAALSAAADALPCAQCGSEAPPTMRKPARGSVEWWDDPATHIGCGECGAWLADLPDIYPAGWPDPNG